MPKVDTMCPTKFIPLSLDTIIGPCATVFSKKFCDLGPWWSTLEIHIGKGILILLEIISLMVDRLLDIAVEMGVP